MRPNPVLLLALPALLVQHADGAPNKAKLDDHSEVAFASAAKGKEILASRDEFISGMSPFDRMVRMKSSEPVTEKELLEFIPKQAIDWTDAEKDSLAQAIKALRPTLSSLKLKLPTTIYFVRTNGKEEQGAVAYTRGEAVIFSMPLKGSEDLQRLICHELFHVLSRHNPAIRDGLYATIGFKKCPDLEFPKGLAKRKLTNPDAPHSTHYIVVDHNGESVSAMPILYSKSEAYDPKKGTTLFHYLDFKMLVVKQSKDSNKMVPVGEKDSPKLLSVPQMRGFFEQIGRNSRLIFHPEEILADNFSHLVVGKKELPTPGVVEGMKKVLAKFARK